MNRRASSRLFHISALVTLCTQGVLYPQGHDLSPANNPAHLWNLFEESPTPSTKHAVEHSWSKQNGAQPRIQNHTGEQTETGDEWEKGWDLEEVDSDDIQSFFELSSEEADSCKIDTPCTEPSDSKNGKPAPVKKSEAPIGNLYFIEQGNAPAPVEARTSYDSEDEEWSQDKLEPKIPGDISTAQKQQPKAQALTKPQTPHLRFEELDPETADLSPQRPPRPSALGKEQVAVPPYTPPYEVSSKPKPCPKPDPKSETAYTPPAPKPHSWLEGPLNAHFPNLDPIADKPKPYREEIIAEVVEDTPSSDLGDGKTPPKTILINFNNVSVIEYIRFISRITNKNFIFDQADLQFNVTIISEEPTTLDNVMTALIQELRIHGLSLIEEGNNLIIHQNREIKNIPRVNVDGVSSDIPRISELVTQVFRLNTLDPEQAKAILRPLLSPDALIETAIETRHLIITDLVANMKKIDTLLKSIDAPNSGLVIGQYVVRNAFMDNLVDLAKQIMLPIAQDQALTFVPHPAAKSIFIVSSPFIVERTISVLQHLDNFQGTTRIYDLDDLKFQPISAPSMTSRTEASQALGTEAAPGLAKAPLSSENLPLEAGPTGKWELGPAGSWSFKPGYPVGKEAKDLPQGQWLLDPNGNWYFLPEGAIPPFQKEAAKPLPGEAPRGRWGLDTQGSWVFQLSPGEELKPERLNRRIKIDEELPLGHIERTKFYIHKLQFRNGEDIVNALQSIADSLALQESANADLIASIQSAQWLEANNSMIITGTDSSISKVKELIDEIDQPPRQVLIEMLILETTIDDSLSYGVSWATKSGGGNTSTAQAFIGTASPLIPAMATTGVDKIPDASNVITTLGYNLGIIGQRLTHNGTQFASLGALITAVHTRAEANVILSPKIITEDNKTAEIFVGINSPYLSNSIANDEGSVITTNVEFRDTGTTLKVTPLIGNGNVITLDIEQEVSRTGSTPTTQGNGTSDVNLTPTTSINRTTTRVHVPNKYFVVISGMIQDGDTTNRNQFPCLGGIPVLGAAFSDKDKTTLKRNLMIFIRPEIIDSGLEHLDITRRQQQILKQKNRMKKSWKFEVDEALDFMNIKPPCCDECD